MGILLSILIFSFVVFIHELGHFIVGLALGAQPQELSIGFGKSILQKTVRGVTYKVGVIPIGGFVQFLKDSNYAEPDKKLSHPRQIFVALAGPLANFALSYIMLYFLVLSILFSPASFNLSGNRDQTKSHGLSGHNFAQW